jgi:DNA-binding XRE family transcriptional regulator
MTTADFGKAFGVSPITVVKWENAKNKISPALELCIRLYTFNHLRAKDKEFRSLYNAINLEQLSKRRSGKIVPLQIDASEDLKIA